MTKFGVYRFLAPIRSRLQRRLREERAESGFQTFSHGIERGPKHEEVTRLLWEHLRQEAFVEDFLPDPQDNLAKVFAMGPEEVRDDLIDPISTQLGIDIGQVDLRGFDFASLATPADVAGFLMDLSSGGSVGAKSSLAQ